MPKSKSKKVTKPPAKKPQSWKGKYLKLPKDAFAAMEHLEKETGKTHTDIIADFLRGKSGALRPDINAYVESEAAKRGVSYEAALNSLVGEAKTLADLLSKHKPS